MTRKVRWLIGGVTVLGLLVMALPARADGIEDFKLTRAIPADTMLVVQTRDHAGLEFLSKQGERVWAAVEKQNFNHVFRRMFKGMIKQQGGDVEEFDRQWQQITDLAAGVTWPSLAQREFAFAMKLGLPTGADFVVLMMPPEDEVADDFTGLTAILKNVVALDPHGRFVVSTEGEGDTVMHRVSATEMPLPASLTLARHKDVLLVGFGSSMVEQSLALLRGESDASIASLASTERFKQAFKRLPPPVDSLYFMDVAKTMLQCRGFAEMAAQMAAQMTVATQPAEVEPGPGPLAFLPRAVDALDMWDYMAGVAATDGMRTTAENITVTRADAGKRPLYQAFYGNGPVRDPLKYVPQEATGVKVGSGIDFRALYRAVVDFVGKEVEGGEDLVAQWKLTQEEMDFDVEQDLLEWLGGGYATFAATRKSAYAPEWVYVLDVRDEQKANAAIDKLCGRLDELLKSQNGGVEDARIEGAEGFKLIILPMIFAMIPGMGQPVLGIKDGHLFIGNSPKIVTFALEVGAGEADNFTKSERFIAEGFPLGGNVTAFCFKDLSKLGEELSRMFALGGLAQMLLPPEVSKNPTVLTLLSAMNKVGNVTRKLDFFRSTCSVTTFDGRVSTTKCVTNYQEPPKPRPAKPVVPEEPAGEEQPEKPEPENPSGAAG